jgi:replication factor C small subunit
MSSAQRSTPFRLSQPDAQRVLAFPKPGPEPVAPAEKYRPKHLGHLVGQPAAVAKLWRFLEKPHPAAFIFEGETGTGKTSAALCLAAHLGAVEFGGLDRINPGDMGGETLLRAIKQLRYTPMLGSGWKLLLVDEADYMVWENSKGVNLFLGALEELPPHSVVVFTTNYVSKFPQRFLDRCQLVAFDSSWKANDGAAELIARVWEGEGRQGPPPELSQLPGVRDAKGHLSFRRLVQAVVDFTAAPAGKGVAR